MKLTLILLILSMPYISLTGQDEIITENNIKGLSAIVDSLNAVFDTKEFTDTLKSFPIAIADYFRITLKNPDDFTENLDKNIPVKRLIELYPNLIVDKDLMITKVKSRKRHDKSFITYRSYDIGNSRGHYLWMPYDSLEFYNNEKGRYLYSKDYDKYDDLYEIYGFYIKSDFQVKTLPSKYVRAIKYADFIIGDATIFNNSNVNKFRRYRRWELTKIDTFIEFYHKAINRPERKDGEDFAQHLERFSKWEEKKDYLTDSLYKHNSQFREKLHEIYNYALQKHKSDDELEYLVEKFMSKQAALNLLRAAPKIGSCSADSSPQEQMKKIARLSADLKKWDVFILSMLNLMNDNLFRVSDNSIVSSMRKTYFSELEKLPLDTKKLLLGISIQISNPAENHYTGNSMKIGKAIANSTRWKEYLDAYLEVLSNPQTDWFNKLHFYNIIKNAYYYTENEDMKRTIDSIETKMVNSLPYVIKNRILHPHLELENLLIRDSAILHQNFEIEESAIGDIYSRYSSGMSWLALFKVKGTEGKIYFNLTMRADDTLSSIKPLVEQKEHYLQMINKNEILRSMLKLDSFSLTVNYVNGKSFIVNRYCKSDTLPENIKREYSSMLPNALLITTDLNDKINAEWILLENGDIILTKLTKGFHFGDYDFESLKTKEKKHLFGDSTYYSFKVFDKNGREKHFSD